MTLTEALGKINAPKGLTTIVSALFAGDLSPIQSQSAVASTLETARENFTAARASQDACQSDWAYWGYEGDKAYWSAAVSIMEAAEITGPNNLPDADPREGVVVMDQCANIEEFGRTILRLAKERAA